MRIALFLSFLTTAICSTEKIEFIRTDKSVLVAYFDAPSATSYPMVIFLQGAQCSSAKPFHDEWKEKLIKQGFGLVTLEKKGIDGNSIDLKVYDESNSLDQRLQDHLLVLEKGRGGAFSEWNRQVVLIGISEGGEVAGKLAAKTSETIGILLFCVGGGWSRIDEILWSFRKQLVEECFSPQYVQSVLVNSRNALQQTLKHPVATEYSFGFTHKYWASILKHHLLESLSQVSCPIYIVQGALDDRIPVQSSDYLVKALEERGKKGIVYRKIETLGHDPKQDPAVYTEAVSWLEKVITSHPES